jgi:hypothetical protein
MLAERPSGRQFIMRGDRKATFPNSTSTSVETTLPNIRGGRTGGAQRQLLLK